MDMETETKVVRLEAELSEARDELKEAKREVGELKARVAVIEVAMSQVISAMGNLEADVIPSMNKTLRTIRGSLSSMEEGVGVERVSGSESTNMEESEARESEEDSEEREDSEENVGESGEEKQGEGSEGAEDTEEQVEAVVKMEFGDEDRREREWRKLEAEMEGTSKLGGALKGMKATGATRREMETFVSSLQVVAGDRLRAYLANADPEERHGARHQTNLRDLLCREADLVMDGLSIGVSAFAARNAAKEVLHQPGPSNRSTDIKEALRVMRRTLGKDKPAKDYDVVGGDNIEADLVAQRKKLDTALRLTFERPHGLPTHLKSVASEARRCARGALKNLDLTRKRPLLRHGSGREAMELLCLGFSVLGKYKVRLLLIVTYCAV